MIRGFNDKAKEAKTSITGGHSVLNPWVMIGGVAMSVVPEENIKHLNGRNERLSKGLQ